MILQKRKIYFINLSFFFSRGEVLCTYPIILSFVHVCIYFWFPLWLFLEQDSLLWNIVLEVSGPFYSLITRYYATYFNMNFSGSFFAIIKRKALYIRRSLVNT